MARCTTHHTGNLSRSPHGHPAPHRRRRGNASHDAQSWGGAAVGVASAGAVAVAGGRGERTSSPGLPGGSGGAADAGRGCLPSPGAGRRWAPRAAWPPPAASRRARRSRHRGRCRAGGSSCTARHERCESGHLHQLSMRSPAPPRLPWPTQYKRGVGRLGEGATHRTCPAPPVLSGRHARACVAPSPDASSGGSPTRNSSRERLESVVPS
jgi:hypothetical protein